MKILKLVLGVVILFTATTVHAQDSSLNKQPDSNTVVIHKDQRLDMLVKKQIEINEETSRNARRSAKGFRLMVVNTNKREEAIDAKTKLYTLFPELKPYLIYQSPYYRLKAGNFKERKDAETYQKKLDSYFPKGVFVINDIIEVKLDKDIDSTDPGL
jgi:hypothetical protein